MLVAMSFNSVHILRGHSGTAACHHYFACLVHCGGTSFAAYI